jgi:outer membrane translocation and assembly module TamA
VREVKFLLCVLFLSACAAAQTATPGRAITVRRLTLQSVDNRLPLQDQQQTIQAIQSRTYQGDNAENVLAEIAMRARYGLQRRGFFKAEVVRPSFTVVSETAGDEIVDISLSVNEGEQYRLKEVTFAGEKAISAADLRGVFSIVDGDIFDVEKIRQGLDALRKFYESKGYINCTPVPNTEVNDAARAISLLVDIDEGAQYRVGALVLDGVERKPGAGAKLLDNWKRYEGQIYAPQVVKQFLRENSAILPAGVSSDNFIPQADEQAHILNFRLDLPDAGEENR